MRTLLVCLACVMLVGCAKPVPPGMEKMGSTDEFKRNSGNSTQVQESYNRRALDAEDADTAINVILGAVDTLAK